jgi:hypothetical protein
VKYSDGMTTQENLSEIPDGGAFVAVGPPVDQPMVTLPTGVEVPADFVFPLTVSLSGGRFATLLLAVHVEGAGVPRLKKFMWTGPEAGLAAEELGPVDLKGHLAYAFHKRAAQAEREKIAQTRGGWAILDVDEVAAADERARLATRKRGPYKVTDEFLRDVMGWHHQGGVKRIMKEAVVSERTARRWYAEAIDRGIA